MFTIEIKMTILYCNFKYMYYFLLRPLKVFVFGCKTFGLVPLSVCNSLLYQQQKTKSIFSMTSTFGDAGFVEVRDGDCLALLFVLLLLIFVRLQLEPRCWHAHSPLAHKSSISNPVCCLEEPHGRLFSPEDEKVTQWVRNPSRPTFGSLWCKLMTISTVCVCLFVRYSQNHVRLLLCCKSWSLVILATDKTPRDTEILRGALMVTERAELKK